MHDVNDPIAGFQVGPRFKRATRMNAVDATSLVMPSEKLMMRYHDRSGSGPVETAVQGPPFPRLPLKSE